MGSNLCQRCSKKARETVRLCEGCLKTLHGVLDDLPWTPFEPADVDRSDPVVAFAFEGDELFLNSRYQVTKRVKNTPSGRMAHLSIKRIDKKPIRDWRDMQRIKNELCGPETEGVEIYPAESRLLDTSNQYHLWVFLDLKLPFGFHEGRLLTEDSIQGSVQQPWPEWEKPKDLKYNTDIVARLENEMRKRKEQNQSES